MKKYYYTQISAQFTGPLQCDEIAKDEEHDQSGLYIGSVLHRYNPFLRQLSKEMIRAYFF